MENKEETPCHKCDELSVTDTKYQILLGLYEASQQIVNQFGSTPAKDMGYWMSVKTQELIKIYNKSKKFEEQLKIEREADELRRGTQPNRD